MWVFGLKMRVGGLIWGIWAKWGRKKVRKREKKCEKLQKIAKKCGAFLVRSSLKLGVWG